MKNYELTIQQGRQGTPYPFTVEELVETTTSFKVRFNDKEEWERFDEMQKETGDRMLDYAGRSVWIEGAVEQTKEGVVVTLKREVPAR